MPDLLASLTGQEARALLQAMGELVTELTEASLKMIDEQTAGGGLTSDHAMALCHQIAAYRRIVRALKSRVTVAERQAQRAADDRLALEGYTQDA